MLDVKFIDLAIIKTTRVEASREDAWRAWTDEAELVRWFCNGAKVELVPGGAYEIYFLMDSPVGSRGGEGNVIQSFQPKRLLAFTWNAPPSFGPLRDQRTFVLLEFTDASDGGTQVKLTHYGWRPGKDWAKVYEYFDAAWARVMVSLTRYLGTSVEE